MKDASDEHRGHQSPPYAATALHAAGREFRAACRDDQGGVAVLSDVRQRPGAAPAERRRSDQVRPGDRIRGAGGVGAQPPAHRRRRAHADLSAGLAHHAARRAGDRRLSGGVITYPPLRSAAKRGRGTILRSKVVEGAPALTLRLRCKSFVESRAPSTILRSLRSLRTVPLPRYALLRGEG